MVDLAHIALLQQLVLHLKFAVFVFLAMVCLKNTILLTENVLTVVDRNSYPTLFLWTL